MILSLVTKVIFLAVNFSAVFTIPDKGKWEYPISADIILIKRCLFRGSGIYIRISCEPDTSNITIQADLHEPQCWNFNLEEGMLGSLQKASSLRFEQSDTQKCADHITPRFSYKSENDPNSRQLSLNEHLSANTVQLRTNPKVPAVSISKDGIYLLALKITPPKDVTGGSVYIEMKGPFGYLSADEWPLLPFFGAMCLVYVTFATVWLVVSFLQWRDLLRIQFWIGAVILIGMIEKAMFYEEYQSINSTGESSLLGTIFIAELVSAAKRSLARILVIIVSLGYGIVKPRLGSHFPRIIAVGITYFVLASVEAYLRVVAKPTREKFTFGSIPLALLDSFICWWIFSSLVQTTRTLRLRRNVSKLTLFNRFTNTLIFAVIASAVFMLYSIKTKFVECVTDWSILWIDLACWHLLFSVILLAIMILWRPTNNNQRYSFSPLLDAPDDEDDDEEIEHFVNDAYGVKMRGVGSTRSDSPKSRTTMDEDLKWVEENIPSSFIDTNLPILDSDEELINTKFEISKMQ